MYKIILNDNFNYSIKDIKKKYCLKDIIIEHFENKGIYNHYDFFDYLENDQIIIENIIIDNIKYNLLIKCSILKKVIDEAGIEEYYLDDIEILNFNDIEKKIVKQQVLKSENKIIELTNDINIKDYNINKATKIFEVLQKENFYLTDFKLSKKNIKTILLEDIKNFSFLIKTTNIQNPKDLIKFLEFYSKNKLCNILLNQIKNN